MFLFSTALLFLILFPIIKPVLPSPGIELTVTMPPHSETNDLILYAILKLKTGALNLISEPTAIVLLLNLTPFAPFHFFLIINVLLQYLISMREHNSPKIMPIAIKTK